MTEYSCYPKESDSDNRRVEYIVHMGRDHWTFYWMKTNYHRKMGLQVRPIKGKPVEKD